MTAAENFWKRSKGLGRPLVIAHRGESARAPENTIEAARRAHLAGADAWEFDVHLTRDEIPVVVHDESLLRTTNVASRFAGDPRGTAGFLVAEFDYAEIRTLDAGSWFVATDGGPRSARAFGTLDGIEDHALFAAGNIRIPTLAEALTLTVELDWAVNVELKSVPSAQPRIVGRALDAIHESGAADRVIVSSFDHAEVARVARAAPRVTTAVLSTAPIYRPAGYCRDWVGADAYHPSVEAIGAESTAYRRRPSASSLRVEDLAELAARGVPVSVFTVNDHRPGGLADHLAEAGVFGVFTDDPAPLARRWSGRGRAAGARRPIL
jgi:glycerophosphoryl diester phosphodiesterase